MGTVPQPTADATTLFLAVNYAMRRVFRDRISSDSLIFRASLRRCDCRESEPRIWTNNFYGLPASADHDGFQAYRQFLVPKRSRRDGRIPMIIPVYPAPVDPSEKSFGSWNAQIIIKSSAQHFATGIQLFQAPDHGPKPIRIVWQGAFSLLAGGPISVVKRWIFTSLKGDLQVDIVSMPLNLESAS